ncbi:restriction endonuclease subunit S [Brevibacterium epidermidis]|uniref:restriction endonuclease subunit S n=1 Tax=Brevibacterium epidermidis TaxID=1698 RepID=UPI000BF56C0B|nr:restriction endonuclease subunit S [Brevibacterium epidermidis]
MSRIDDLIQKHCPDGVAGRPLGSLGTRNKGTAITASKMKTIGGGGPIRVFAGGQTVADVAEDAIPAKDVVRIPSIIVKSRGHIGFSYYEHPFTHKTELWSYSIDDAGVDQKFVYYYLLTQVEKLQALARATSVKLPQLSVRDTDTLRIPVPPLEVQREIVRVLDKFTQLEAELEAELEARQLQRVALANNFEVAARDRVAQNVIKLGSIASQAIDPVPVVAGQFYNSLGVKWRGEGVLIRKSRDGAEIKATTLYRAQPGQLVYNKMFVVEGSFAIVPEGDEPAAVSNEFPVFNIDRSKVEPLWLLEHLCNPYTLRRIEREVTGTERGTMKSRRRWKSGQFLNFEIDLPPLDEQREIVRVLRASDRLISSLESELAARRKQYEYYRDRLLTFEELTA